MGLGVEEEFEKVTEVSLPTPKCTVTCQSNRVEGSSVLP